MADAGVAEGRVETLVQTNGFIWPPNSVLHSVLIPAHSPRVIRSIALDAYVLKMPLGVQIGSLGDENASL